MADEPELSRLKSDIGARRGSCGRRRFLRIKPNDWQRIGGHHAFQLAAKFGKAPRTGPKRRGGSLSDACKKGAGKRNLERERYEI